MLSFKSIAGFLKKVGGGREEAGRDGRPKGAQEGGGGVGILAGAGTAAAASAVGGSGGGADTNENGHHRSSLSHGRAVGSSSPHHHGDAGYDSLFSEFPTSGMSSAFGDNVMFASSHILQGLPPNTSTHDVLLHIQRVVQERSKQLLQEEREEQLRLAVTSQRVSTDGCTSIVDATGAVLAPAASKRASTSLASGDGSDWRLAPSGAGSPVSVSKERLTTPQHAPVAAAITSPTKSTATPVTAAAARDQVHRLQKMRAEMIDALDVCLQEVPEDSRTWGTAVSGGASPAKSDKPSTDAASQAQQQQQPLLSATNRSHSVVLPSVLIGTTSSLVTERRSGSPDAPDPNADAEGGVKVDSEICVSRQESSATGTPLEAVDAPATLMPDQPATVTAVVGHYEWRRLLMDIIDVLVRIDQALLRDVRQRSVVRLVPAASSGGASGTEFRWECLPQVLPGPLNPARTGPAAAGGEAAASATRAALPATPTRSPRRRTPTGDAMGTKLHSPLSVHAVEVPAVSSGGTVTPNERVVMLHDTAADSATPLSRMKPALVESCVLSPDPRSDLALNKDDKKLLEELLTVGCSLASWAIAKAILRHHLRVLEQRQQHQNGGGNGGNAPGPTTGAGARPSAEASPAANVEGTATGTGISTSAGRPPLAPPPPPPPAAMKDLAEGAMGDAAEAETAAVGAASTAATTSAAAKHAKHVSALDEVDAVPYIDWAAVVQELSEWMGEQQHIAIAECTLCASFLRDDGREMVLCMLQTPKPRKLLTNIHRHAERLRRADVDVLAGAAASPRGLPATGSSSSVSSGAAPSSGSTTTAAAAGTSSNAPGSAAQGAPTTSSAGGAAGAAASAASGPSASATSSASAPTSGTSSSSSTASTPTPAGAAGVGAVAAPASKGVAAALAAAPSGASNTIRGMLEDSTLVMDDLVARLETTYRKAIANTWATYLEEVIEANVQRLAEASAAAAESDASPTSAGGEELPSVSHTLAGSPALLSVSAVSLHTAPPALQQLECISDTKTLCRLATAFFFGSDAWSASKRERRYSLLYRSMRSRTERYSESAATRRHQRRGTLSTAPGSTASPIMAPAVPSAGASGVNHADHRPPTESAVGKSGSTSVAAAAPPSSSSSPPSGLSAQPLAAAAPAIAPASSAAAAALLTTTAAVAGAAEVTPSKFRVEDTSSRGTPTPGCPHGSTHSDATTAAAARQGNAPTPPLVAHQLLSSNVSTAAVSAHSTPLATSLLISRDGGASDAEPTAAGPTNGSDLFTVGPTERSTGWTPFALVMTPSEPLTPPPEPQQPFPSGTTAITTHRSTEDTTNALVEPSEAGSRRAMESSALSMPTVTLNAAYIGGAGGASWAQARVDASAAALPTPTASTTAPGASAGASYTKGPYSALEALLLERIVNMSWSAALHKRGEQCLTAKPPRLEESERAALEERLVAGAFGEFRARQRAIVSLIHARLASGKSVEALTNAQKHFKFEKKDWTSHNQTIFSAMRYLQSMVFLVRAQAACRVYGAVIETVQFVLPQAALCEQMLQVLAPRPRGDYILRFCDCRSKLLRSYVYLLKECWLAHAAFNDLGKAEKCFVSCAQVMQMLRRRVRETELFTAYMERGSQLMKLKEYKRSVELFRFAVNIAKKSLHAADVSNTSNAAFSSNTSVSSTAPSLASTATNMANAVSAAAAGLGAKPATADATQQGFHRNLHLRVAGSGSLTTAEEHIPGATDAAEDDLELVWRVAESERMLALSYVTQAEHEVNLRERREELSNAVSSAYSSQRSLQRWQTKGGTPKRLLTAVPCSLIVICKGLLLINQPRKAALLLEPLIENKPNSAVVRPPMWQEILHPTEDPYTAEDVVLRTDVSSVKITLFMLYARCLAEFDGERALRAVTQVDRLLLESDAWIRAIRTELRLALDELRLADTVAAVSTVTGSLGSPRVVHGVERLRRAASAAVPHNGGAGAARGSAAVAGVEHGSEDGGDDTHSNLPVHATPTPQQQQQQQQHAVSAALTSSAVSTVAGRDSAQTTEVPPLHIPSTHSLGQAPSSLGDGHNSPVWDSPDDPPLRTRRVTAAGASTAAVVADSTSAHEDSPPYGGSQNPPVEDDERSRRSASLLYPSSVTGNGQGGTAESSATVTVPAGRSDSGGRTLSATTAPPQQPYRLHMESSSECITALFALREAKSHIRKALRDILIVSGDAHALIKHWEEALKVYSHALVISTSEVEAASAAARPRRRVSHASPRGHFSSLQSSTEPFVADDGAPLAASQHNAKGGTGGAGGATGGGTGSSAGPHHVPTEAGLANAQLQGWGQIAPLDEEFFLWDEEDVLIADNMINRELTESTAAKDLRAVVADEERMDSRACENLVLSKLANVYRALDKPTTAIHYHTLVMEYADECHDKLLAYNSMLSLARLHTAAKSVDKAREAWARVSELAKEYEDKEVSRETMRNIVAGQEAAGMYMDVVKTAEELEKLASSEEGDDAAADRRFALEALARANLELGQYDACVAALDSREKVQEKSAEWSGALLSMRAKARMGLNKSAEAIKVMQSWAAKARNLGNWVEFGKANAALSAAYASENHNMQARMHHEATLNAFALAETLDEDCRHIALDSARWLVHYAYLGDSTLQVDPSLTFTGGGLTSDSEASGGDPRYVDSGLCNSSGDLGMMLAKEEELRRSSSMLGEDCKFGRSSGDEEEEGEGEEDEEDVGSFLSNHSMYGSRPAELSLAVARMARDRGVDTEAHDDAAADASSSPPPMWDDNGDGEDGDGDYEDGVDTSSFTSATLMTASPKDPGSATQPPSLAGSMNLPARTFPSQLVEPLGGVGSSNGGGAANVSADHSEGSSTAGQSDGGDAEVVDDVDEDARGRLEVHEVLRRVDAAAQGSDEPAQRLETSAGALEGAVTPAESAALPHQPHDPQLVASTEAEEAVDPLNVKRSPPKPATAAAKPTTYAAAVVRSATPSGKSASSNYVPPPTGLANVSICSRPAAAAAGTDVLELPVGASRTGSDAASGSNASSTSSALQNSAPRGSATSPAGASCTGGTGAAAAAAGAGGVGGDAEAGQERKPSTVHTTYFRGAMEMIETAAQLLLVPRSVRHYAIPYSPAEAVDFALLAHPQSLFVFYFAEYTTEYGAQCDVVVRPPGTANFMKLRSQISLKEYHSKDALSSVLASLSADVSMTGTDAMSSMDANPTSAAHPFSSAMARAGTSAAGGPNLANVTPTVLRAALEEETTSCLRNLYADAWQPIVDRMQRDRVTYQDAETVIIMPDVSLIHLPFAGLLPSPSYGDEEAPLGEQFTLIVTPSMTHFVHHGMTRQTHAPPRGGVEVSGALDPAARRYIFLPYEGINAGSVSAASAPLAMPNFVPCAPRSPNVRPQSQSPAKPSGSKAPPTLVQLPSAAASPPSAPQSLADSTVTLQALAAGDMSLRSSNVPADTAASPYAMPQPPVEKDYTFDELLRTWRVHQDCTRKELIQAFTDVQTRALMFLAPVDPGMIRVADGVVTIQDLAQNLQLVRAQTQQQQQQHSAGIATTMPISGTGSNTTTTGGAAHAASSATSVMHSSSAATTPAGATITAVPSTASTQPPIPLPPLCTHIDLLVLTSNRSQYPSINDAGVSARMCMVLGVHRVLRLNIVHGLSANDEQRAFIALYLTNLRKVMRWSLQDPYAVALRTTIAEARGLGMSSNTWGAFTLVGVP